MRVTVDGCGTFGLAGLLSGVIGVALFSPFALAQESARPETIGVGLDDCGRVNEAGLSTTRTSAQQTVDEVEYSSWFYGWLTGFSIASVVGGLGGIDLTDGQSWAKLVATSCRDSGTSYSDAVRLVAAREVLRHRSVGVPSRVVGLGRSDCSRMTAPREAGQPDYSAGYRQWAFGYVSGYNAFRGDVGLKPLRVPDEATMFASAEEHCRRNATADFNTAVAVWVLDAEAQQKAAPIPPNATPTSTGLTAESLRPAALSPNGPVPRESIAGVGAWACDRVTSNLAAESPDVSGALNEANALGWFRGYLSASDAIRALMGRASVDWAAVNAGMMWAQVKNACRRAPSDTFASIAAQREASLVREAPDRSGATEVTNLGAGSLPCSYLDASGAVENSAAGAKQAAERLLSESELIGWAEGYFSALNLHRRDSGNEPLDLRDIGRLAREGVGSFCREGSEPIARAMVRFGTRNYPGLFADLRPR